MDNFNHILKPFSNKSPDNPENHSSNGKRQSSLISEPWVMVQQWYNTQLGQTLLIREKQLLEQVLESVFGYNLLQLGCLDGNGLLSPSRLCCQCLIQSSIATEKVQGKTQFICDFGSLALQKQSIDCIVLPHTLEFEADPHQILREVERVLVAEGKLIILGFNPYSLWGLWHKYWELKRLIKEHNRYFRQSGTQIPLPSCGQLISQKRLGDWLQLLGFNIDTTQGYFYRPPVNHKVILNNLSFMEQAQELSGLFPAGAYLMVATKRVSTLTPIRERWKFPNKLVVSDTIEPAGYESGSRSLKQN